MDAKSVDDILDKLSQDVRDAALETAAKACEMFKDDTREELAARIRRLKTPARD